MESQRLSRQPPNGHASMSAWLVARAAEGDTAPTDSTYRTLIDGLFITVTNVSFDDEAIIRQIERTHREKAALVPMCQICSFFWSRPVEKESTFIRTAKCFLLTPIRH